MRDVCMISSKHKLDFDNVIDIFGRSKLKLKMVVDYSTKMSGIDRADQIISYYPIPRKECTGMLKFFFHVMDCLSIER